MNIRTAKEREADKRKSNLYHLLFGIVIGALFSGPAWLHLFGSLS